MLRGFIEEKARAWRTSQTDALNRIIEDARLSELGASPPQPTASKKSEPRDSDDQIADDIFGEMV
jgi:hypothetical protein